MTLLVPDVNVLVYGFRTDAPEHDAYAQWFNNALATDTIGLSDTIVSGFIRAVTHPRIYAEPTPIAAATAYVRHMLASPRAEWLRQGAPAWQDFQNLAAVDAGIRGNLVPDAYIAALCLSNGAQLATRDRGFARFPGLKWFDPARSIAVDP